MRNIRLEIEYDGTNYCGWQIQNRHTSGAKYRWSIQEVIEKTLQKILQEKIKIIASGRTDAGVHARAQTANFKTNNNISPEKLQKALNGLLPEDISVNKVFDAPLNFHSRFSAKTKVYRYTILNRSFSQPLLRNTVYHYPYPLNIRLMQDEANALLGRHDFKAFCASNSNIKDTFRTIKKISIRKTSSCTLCPISTAFLVIEIEADGFLYNMVRNITGTLLEIGRGKFPVGSIKKILHSANRIFAGPTAPAKGLCLLKVKYHSCPN
ncbi:MAG: tRNA pseudouridine(38-40) synthase TruA [Candidatus Omnitrophota bacterium]|nr:tRNA pseudouridine(38-40) synthase TruA [Candidatus Omnitrophota bacterium]